MAEIITATIPVLKKGYHRMTLPFGDQTLRGSAYKHKGVDLTGNPDVSGGYDDILAFASGTVITAGWHKDCGYWVRIDHGDGIFTRYMHLKKGSLKVKVGDKVTKGQTLGIMGATGNVTGRHLHFDISFKGNVVSQYGGFYESTQNRTYIDPVPYLIGKKTLLCTEYTAGVYEVIKAVNVRKGPGTNYSRVKYKNFTDNAKAQISKLGGNPSANDFPKGMKLTLKEFEQDKNGAWWGKCPSGWVFIKNYLKKI